MSPTPSQTSQSSIYSDITSFADWEALHPSHLVEENSREPSVLAADMAREDRVWRDRDSSNDARSSDAEEGEELSVVKVKKAGKRDRKRERKRKSGKEVKEEKAEMESQDLVSTATRLGDGF
jgi:hypothetical protein